MSDSDYYSVRGSKGQFVANVLARDSRHALRVARDHVLTVPRGSTAGHIGREGYYRALQRTFATTALK